MVDNREHQNAFTCIVNGDKSGLLSMMSFSAYSGVRTHEYCPGSAAAVITMAVLSVNVNNIPLGLGKGISLVFTSGVCLKVPTHKI